MIILKLEDKIVTLNSPNWGDSITILLNTVYKKTRDGTMYSTANPSQKKILQFNFMGMNRNKIEELKVFLNSTAGRKIYLVDHNNRTWFGIIKNNPFEATHTGVRNNTFVLTFEGE